MRAFLKILATVLGGIALGLVVTWYTLLHQAGMGGGVNDGPWRTSLLTGSNQGGMWLRAFVALHGLLALNRSETIYYTATSDSAGHRLDGTKCYRIDGRDPPARWWSITAYGPDDYLIPNAAHRYSVSKNSVPLVWGLFYAYVSARSHNGTQPASDVMVSNSISVAPGPFSLTMRLYNPDPKVAKDPAHVALPAIREVACQ